MVSDAMNLQIMREPIDFEILNYNNILLGTGCKKSKKVLFCSMKLFFSPFIAFTAA